MAEELNIFDKDTSDDLLEMLNAWRRKSSGRSVGDLPDAPPIAGVYIAKPSVTLPAWTGEGSPPKVICELFRLHLSDLSEDLYEVEALENPDTTPFSEMVHNVLAASFPTDKHFLAINTRHGHFVAIGSAPDSNASGGGSGPCGCSCLPAGDILVGGMETMSLWKVTLLVTLFEQSGGTITVPAGDYILEWDGSQWFLDIGDDLLAYYPNGDEATADTTLSGSLKLEWSPGVPAVITLEVSGDIPDAPGTGT